MHAGRWLHTYAHTYVMNRPFATLGVVFDAPVKPPRTRSRLVYVIHCSPNASKRGTPNVCDLMVQLARPLLILAVPSTRWLSSVLVDVVM